MHVDAAKLLWDAQQGLQRIERFVAGKDFNAYQSDELLRSAVERQFEILGEALNRLSGVDPDTAGKVPGVAAHRRIQEHPGPRLRECRRPLGVGCCRGPVGATA